MITLTARIDLISGGEISSVTSNFEGNNISGDIPYGSDKKKVKNPFILGASVLGEGATFEKKVEYYIGNQPSDEKGHFAVPYELVIEGSTNLNSLTIAFDTQNNRYPCSIYVDGEEYNDNDPIYTIPSLTEYDYPIYYIRINDWSAPKFPLVISGIYVNISLNINKQNLISLKRSIFERSDYKFPSYGIISNTGNIEFNDLDGEIRDYAEQLILTSDLKVTINLNNTLTKTSEQVGKFETREWNYDNDNRIVSVSLKDNLEEWQDILVEGFSFDPRNPYAVLENGTMENLYKWLWNVTPSKYEMISFDKLDEITKNILKKTKIKYPFLKSGNLWQQWQKLCEVCALYIYKNNEGKTVCAYKLGS